MIHFYTLYRRYTMFVKNNSIEIKNIAKVIMNTNDLTMTEAFNLFDIAFDENTYHTVSLNREMMDFFNVTFLYYKKNHHLKYDKYSCFWKEYTFRYDNGETETYWIYSIVLHDETNTFIVFNDNVSITFKKLVYNLSKLNYMDFLKKRNIDITDKEKQLLSMIEEYKYPVYEKDNDDTHKSIQFCKEVLDTLYKEQSVINDRKTFLLKDKLIRATKTKNQYHIKSVIKSLKRNKQAYNACLMKIYTFTDKLDHLQEPLLKAEDDFKFKSLLMNEEDDIDIYDNFNYDDYYKSF